MKQEIRSRAITVTVTEAEYDCVLEAAADAHLTPYEYARLIVLCASGMGGAFEYLQRAIQASIVAGVASGELEKVS